MGAKLSVKYQMMLPSDMVLLWDEEFKKYLQIYAEDEELLKKDFGEFYPACCQASATNEW